MTGDNTRVWVKPKPVKTITLAPYQLIPYEADQTGGGIRCRLHDGSYVDLVWGKQTTIEVAE